MSFPPTKTVSIFALLLASSLLTSRFTSADAPAAFGDGLKVPARTPLKPLAVKPLSIDCFSPQVAPLWTVELPPDGVDLKQLFSITDGPSNGNEGPALSIKPGLLAPARTTVRVLLPGDGPANGDNWAKAHATHVSFYCKASEPVQMTFHLLQRGKTAGTYQAGFTAQSGEWRQVLLPLSQFNLKSFAKVAGLGFRVANAAAKDATVQIRDIRVGGERFSDDSWKSQRASISLKGDWRFNPAAGDEGIAQKWFAGDFDDSSWRTLQSARTWQDQGVQHHGFGWYRQHIFVPKEMAGTPLTITLCKIQSDDDAWFNGQRIGGWSGEYKYDNYLVRTYTVPPELIRYGETNTIALRIWGGNLTFIGDKSGLIAGPLVAELDPYAMLMREPGGSAVPADLFDLSDTQRGKPFEIGFALPAEVTKQAQNISYRVSDFAGNEITTGTAKQPADENGVARIWVPLDRTASQTAYLRGRLRVNVLLEGTDGDIVYNGVRTLDRLNFLKRDRTPLPALAEKLDDTPYGKLKLVDEIDASTPLADEPHPYLQSAFDHSQDRVTPGADVDVHVTDILGRKARESGFGWFAYRIGRGQLKPHATYLVRIEYPEDKPRYAPIEIQTGQNFMDVGWKNGVGADDVYDNWPLSGKWQWYDVIIPLDDETVGTGGTGTASAANGLWLYFMNKLKPNAYFAMYSGGPAVGRIRLYEIDTKANAPHINAPAGLPQRVLAFDWERQPDAQPADLVRYAKLMGYNAISPVIIKWGTANYGPELPGYSTVRVDPRSYWSTRPYDAAKHAFAPADDLPPQPSTHEQYLAETKRFGINYIPRFEWGGSLDVPQEAWAIGIDGKPLKPNRFATWCVNLLNPLAWDDLQRLMDTLIKPYAADNPQLIGALWRIRCNRVPISYGRADLDLFAKETGTKLPAGGLAQQAAWAAGEGKAAYDTWWHGKRAAFHRKLVDLLRSYRPDLTLYYYNWDEDKFGLINTDLGGWGFLATLGNDGKAAYEKDRAARRSFTAADYIEVLRTGNFGDASKGINRADYGLRPALYKNMPGFEPFAPVDYLCYANMPDYLNYFRTADGVAVSNAVSYDEIGSRSINPKYEGNMITPAGPDFSMALELLAYFHSDARTLTYTAYTYGRGFADAHRRFAQAFLALPAIPGEEVPQKDTDMKVRLYKSDKGTFVGVAYKGYSPKKLAIDIPLPAGTSFSELSNLVSANGTGERVNASFSNGHVSFELDSGPMQLHALRLK